jgi:folate-binding protein YgfZ
MGPTALQQNGQSLGATRAGEYRGAMAAARFGDPQKEWAQLNSGCGVYDLGFRVQISLTGKDRVRWLNGMVTNNIRDLAAGHGVYAFLLNPQGHILGDLYAYNRGESVTVDTDRSQLEKILATFDHYIIMDDVEVNNESNAVTAIGVAGPRVHEVLKKAGFEFPELRPLQLREIQCDCDCGCVKCTIVRGDNAAGESYEIWLAPAHVKALWDALIAAGAAPVGFEALELRRVESGIPLYGGDIRERDLPQETEQARALNFNKGCYVGQEIVERIRSRGAVHRKFTGFMMKSAAQIVSGTKIVAGEKEVGEITSVAKLEIAGESKTLALGYIRREAGTPGREVSIGDEPATVSQLPFDVRVPPQRPVEGLAEIEEPLERHRV